jgi:hypothetical protein
MIKQLTHAIGASDDEKADQSKTLTDSLHNLEIEHKNETEIRNGYANQRSAKPDELKRADDDVARCLSDVPTHEQTRSLFTRRKTRYNYGLWWLFGWRVNLIDPIFTFNYSFVLFFSEPRPSLTPPAPSIISRRSRFGI